MNFAMFSKYLKAAIIQSVQQQDVVWTTEELGFDCRRGKIFFSIAFIPPLGPHPAFYTLVNGRQSGRGLKLTTHLYRVQRYQMRGAVSPFSHMLTNFRT
jgi:hypothetical protein